MNDPFIGKSIHGYEIKEKIGKGCLGVVYKAIREDLDDIRAVKFVPMDVVNRKKIGSKKSLK